MQQLIPFLMTAVLAIALLSIVGHLWTSFKRQ